MNIPTWLIVFMSVVYLIWSLIEIQGFLGYMEMERKGYRPYYKPLSKMFTYLWFLIGVAAICYLIFG